MGEPEGYPRFSTFDIFALASEPIPTVLRFSIKMFGDPEGFSGTPGISGFPSSKCGCESHSVTLFGDWFYQCVHHFPPPSCCRCWPTLSFFFPFPPDAADRQCFKPASGCICTRTAVSLHIVSWRETFRLHLWTMRRSAAFYCQMIHWGETPGGTRPQSLWIFHTIFISILELLQSSNTARYVVAVLSFQRRRSAETWYLVSMFCRFLFHHVRCAAQPSGSPFICLDITAGHGTEGKGRRLRRTALNGWHKGDVREQSLTFEQRWDGQKQEKQNKSACLQMLLSISFTGQTGPEAIIIWWGDHLTQAS